MCANTSDCMVFSLDVNYTDIFTLNFDFFHMRRLNILCISNLNKILTQYKDRLHYKSTAYMVFYLNVRFYEIMYIFQANYKIIFSLILLSQSNLTFLILPDRLWAYVSAFIFFYSTI